MSTPRQSHAARRTSITIPASRIGGPVLIPGTNFNKNRDKLFFFTGYEYFYQVSIPACCAPQFRRPGMLNGDFSPAELAKLGNITASGRPPDRLMQDDIPGRHHSGHR